MNESAFAALYEQHVGIVRAVLYRVFPSGALDDLTQEVFLRAWRGRAQFRGDASPKTWLCKIARHVAIDALRERRRVGPAAGEEALERVAAPSGDPSARALVRSMLGRLDPDDRLLLTLLAVEGCTMAEVGEILGIPEGTVKSCSFALRHRVLAELTIKEVANG